MCIFTFVFQKWIDELQFAFEMLKKISDKVFEAGDTPKFCTVQSCAELCAKTDSEFSHRRFNNKHIPSEFCSDVPIGHIGRGTGAGRGVAAFFPNQ